MAIKIIKPGTKNFKMECSKCDCIFEYSMEDLNHRRTTSEPDTVNCPCCNQQNYHSWRDRRDEEGK